MTSNYYTIRHIVSDLERRWKGKKIESCFSQERNELAVSIRREGTLLVSCEPSANSLYLRSDYARAKKNTMDLFPACSNKVIQSLSIHPSDREIVFGLEGGVRLMLQLYGSKANAYLVDSNRVVLDAFLHPREMMGMTLDAPSESHLLPSSQKEFTSRLRTVESRSVSAAVRRLHPLLGSMVTRELLVRAELDEKSLISELDSPGMKKLFLEFQSILAELTGPPFPCIYYSGSHPSTFSIIKLRHLPEANMKNFDSIHTAIQVFLASSRREQHLQDERTWVMEKLEKERDKIARTLAKVREEGVSAEKADWFERAGKLLMAFLPKLSRGMKTVTLDNVFSGSQEPVEIPLDVHLTPVKNAERYFEKARKARNAIGEQAERSAAMTLRLNRLEALLASIGALDSMEEWKEFAGSHQSDLKEAGIVVKGSTVKKEEERIPFRVFTVDGGFQVWAGKNSENNDLLTLKFARPNDLWFHARGSGGSHVVLRLGTGKGEISKRALEQTAGIAAYYSKMKNAGLVPVAMTEKKYVRKPKGSPAGTVMIEREKVLMVPPRLPD